MVFPVSQEFSDNPIKLIMSAISSGTVRRFPGFIRRASSINTQRVDDIYEDPSIMNRRFILHYGDIIDSSSGSSSISYKRVLSKCLNEAIDNLISMRLKEGKNLSDDIGTRLNKINKNLGLIVRNSQKDQKKILRDYKKKIKSLIDKNSKIVLDDNRLLQEIVIYMEKKDINEEITRLRSHINVFADCLNKGKIEKGKRMTFLLQEFLREINTIGSKTDNVKTSHLVVSIKTEIEKIREQVQNIL